jgi:hypothetical protein
MQRPQVPRFSDTHISCQMRCPHRLAVCVSQADKATKAEVKQLCAKIGARYAQRSARVALCARSFVDSSVHSSWSHSITHLVCGKLKATAKLLLALTNDVPIVSVMLVTSLCTVLCGVAQAYSHLPRALKADRIFLRNRES